MNIKFNNNIELNKGDTIKVIGEYKETNYYKNEGNFNYKNYLKKYNIYGNLAVDKIEAVKTNNNIINNLNKRIKEKIRKKYSKQASSLIETIILGDKTNLSDTVKEEFSNSGLSHLLAISGMHIALIILIANMILDYMIKNYKLKNILLLIIIIIYGILINLSSSSVRAIIMASLHIISKLIYKKDSFLVNISLASLILLIINPYNLIDTGFQLSFLASIGIVIILQKIRKIDIKNKIIKYIYVSLLVSLAANSLILPIIIISFKKFSLSMFLIQTIITPLLYIIEVLGLATIVIPSQFIFIIKPILEPVITTFNSISKINFFTLYIKVPSQLTIFIYYLLVLTYIIKPRRKIIKKICKKAIILLLILNLILSIINKLDTNLKIYMIDVGQGDSTLIITPKNKTILVDGGGLENYDIGEKVLIPYLLNKQVKTLDYIMISHFDRDHVGGILTLIEKLKVKNIIISKQKESNDNLKEFLQTIKNKDSNIILVEAGKRLEIEKDIYIDILWPTDNSKVSENMLNNNSIVAKINYKKISILFTGDIEEKAEKEILKQYKTNEKILKSNILKVAHHGSKSSSSKAFLEKVRPNIAIIGVGKNNKFGHPNKEVINNILKYKTEIYRTDEDGEIKINTDGIKITEINTNSGSKR